MDQTGSLVDTNLKVYPSAKFIAFLETIPISGDVPHNILSFIKDNEVSKKEEREIINMTQKIQLSDTDIKILNRIKEVTANHALSRVESNNGDTDVKGQDGNNEEDMKESKDDEKLKENGAIASDVKKCTDKLYLTTSDIDWVYAHINERKSKSDENVPYLHELFKGTEIEMPENKVIRRNPILEARCVKLRSQQEAREYRKMTKGVDNVRMRFPEDSISYQLKQMNRQLIAIGQFIISIFAGFLFGFRGVEWMVGNLDFGVRLLLGVMCALIIALAEIYFLAKKLNEELTMTETIQLGGPPKFTGQPDRIVNSSATENKEHQD